MEWPHQVCASQHERLPDTTFLQPSPWFILFPKYLVSVNILEHEGIWGPPGGGVLSCSAFCGMMTCSPSWAPHTCLHLLLLRDSAGESLYQGRICSHPGNLRSSGLFGITVLRVQTFQREQQQENWVEERSEAQPGLGPELCLKQRSPSRQRAP